MSCDGFRGLISPYVDGELTGEDQAAFEAHLAGCDSCRRAVEEEQAMVAAFQRSLPIHRAPALLREGIQSLLNVHPPRGPRRWILPLAAVLALAALAITLWVARPRAAGRGASSFAAVAAHTHLRYAGGQLPLEVTSDRPEIISRWFEGRVPFRLRLPAYPVAPGQEKLYHLEGGRLISVGDHEAAYIAFRMGGRPISLLVASAEDVRPEGGSIVTSGSLRFHLEPVAGLKVIAWTDQGLTYALASEVAVEGALSCIVCHGSAEERRRIESFPASPGS